MVELQPNTLPSGVIFHLELREGKATQGFLNPIAPGTSLPFETGATSTFLLELCFLISSRVCFQLHLKDSEPNSFTENDLLF